MNTTRAHIYVHTNCIKNCRHRHCQEARTLMYVYACIHVAGKGRQSPPRTHGGLLHEKQRLLAPHPGGPGHGRAGVHTHLEHSHKVTANALVAFLEEGIEVLHLFTGQWREHLVSERLVKRVSQYDVSSPPLPMKLHPVYDPVESLSVKAAALVLPSAAPAISKHATVRT